MAPDHDPLDVVKLRSLMDRTSGRAEVKVGVIDGPVIVDHPDLESARIEEWPAAVRAESAPSDRDARVHGTFVTGILAARRGSHAPAICPGCTILVHPIFGGSSSGTKARPSATPQVLATTIRDCVDAGARVVNLSLALEGGSAGGNAQLMEALRYAARRGVLVVAAAGNEGTLRSSTITGHPWVISVAACDGRGRPLSISNLGRSIGSRGVAAPGDAITSLGPEGRPLSLGGTSAAAPFVTGAIALLASEFPMASPAEIRLAVTRASAARCHAVVPPLLDAEAAYQMLARRG